MNHPQRIRRLATASALAAVLLMSACGSSSGDNAGDATVAANTTDAPAEGGADGATDNETVETTVAEATTIPATTTPLVPPTATIPVDIEEAFPDGVAPLDAEGEFLPTFDAETDDAAVGTQPPTLIGYDIEGELTRYNPATDGATLLLFLAHWCPHCNDEVPAVNELRDAGQIPDDLDVIAVATGSNPSSANYPPTDWLRDLDWTYDTILDGIGPVTLDGETALNFVAMSAYGGSGFPFAVLVDADGNVAARWSGELGADGIAAKINDNL